MQTGIDRMGCCLVKGVASPANVHKRQSTNVADAQGNIQIPQAHIAVDTQNPLTFRSKGHSDAGANRGFACSAFSRQDCNQLSQSAIAPQS